MTRMARKVLERKLEQVHRLALEPTDARTRELLTQLIEELEFRIEDGSADGRLREEARHNHYTGII